MAAILSTIISNCQIISNTKSCNKCFSTLICCDSLGNFSLSVVLLSALNSTQLHRLLFHMVKWLARIPFSVYVGIYWARRTCEVTKVVDEWQNRAKQNETWMHRIGAESHAIKVATQLRHNFGLHIISKFHIIILSIVPIITDYSLLWTPLIMRVTPYKP